jgi:hypothetical protein
MWHVREIGRDFSKTTIATNVSGDGAIASESLYRLIHFGLTAFYTVMNFLHAALDLTVLLYLYPNIFCI